jgi:hypothetical protein
MTCDECSRNNCQPLGNKLPRWLEDTGHVHGLHGSMATKAQQGQATRPMLLHTAALPATDRAGIAAGHPYMQGFD